MFTSLTGHLTPFGSKDTVAFGTLRGWVAKLAREVRIRRDQRTLESFNDAMLHDIGLSRGSIEDTVRNGRLRRPSGSSILPKKLREPASSLPLSWTEWR